ncbi:MAG: trypsin-like serine protease [Solirubrobacteraceae bacterium]
MDAAAPAAHCLEGGVEASQIDVVAGGVRLTDPALQRAQASRVVVHPGYDASAPCTTSRCSCRPHR